MKDSLEVAYVISVHASRAEEYSPGQVSEKFRIEPSHKLSRSTSYGRLSWLSLTFFKHVIDRYAMLSVLSFSSLSSSEHLSTRGLPFLDDPYLRLTRRATVF